VRVHIFAVNCDVCGGEGAADIRTSAAAWDAYATVAHVDPSVCRDNLRREREELERDREKANV
jgi:hypothetical protein